MFSDVHITPRHLVRTLLTVAIGCGLTFPKAALAQSQSFSTDMFWCYTSFSISGADTVQLADEFDSGTPIEFLVGRPVRFCNPVRVNNGIVAPITNSDSHLTFYKIVDPAILTRLLNELTIAAPREVVIQNVFGRDTLDVFHEELVGLPTQLFTGGIPVEPHDLDHFKCYRASGGRRGRSLTLEDLFQTQKHVKVGAPFSFCNPAEKTHNGVVTAILHPQDYLVCYFVTPNNPFGGNRAVDVFDQFNTTTQVLEESDLLCVPTQKISPSGFN